MIYNLVEYLVIQLAAIDFVANSWGTKSPSDAVLVTQSGGDVSHYYDRSDHGVQVLSRAGSAVVAKEQIDNVYELLKNKFRILLPAVTVNEVVYAAVQTYQISPIQTPAHIGADDANLEMWSVNFVITTT